MWFRKKADRDFDLGNLIPVKAVGDEIDENGNIIVLRPKFVHGPLAWWLQHRLKRPYFRVHLDKIGSYVWNLIDGNNTINDIAKQLEQKFGKEVFPAKKRVELFMKQLKSGDMIEFWEAFPESLDDSKSFMKHDSNL